GRLWATYVQSNFAQTLTPDVYRHSVAYEQQSWELSGLPAPQPHSPYTPEQVQAAFQSATPLPFENTPSLTTVERRLIEHRREYFYDNAATDDDVLGILPLGDIGL